MKPDTQTGAFVPSARSNKSLFAKLVIFALLLAVAGLATTAKNGQYFPNTSPAHHVSISTKMNVANSSVRFAADDLQPMLFSLQPPMRATRVEHTTAPPLIIRLCLTDSKQFRAPPAARA
jgi:hypothetical protein